MKYGDVVKMRETAEDYRADWINTRLMVVRRFEESASDLGDLYDGIVVIDSRGVATGLPMLFYESEWEVVS